MAPPGEGRVEDDAEHGTEHRVGALRAHERAVRAVVEDDEGADHEPGRGNRQREHEEIRDPEGNEHRRHQRQIGDDGRRHVEQRRSQSRSHVRRENRAPGFVRGGRARPRSCPGLPCAARVDVRKQGHATDDGCLENVMKRPFPRGVGRWTAPLSIGMVEEETGERPRRARSGRLTRRVSCGGRRRRRPRRDGVAAVPEVPSVAAGSSFVAVDAATSTAAVGRSRRPPKITAQSANQPQPRARPPTTSESQW